MMRFGLIMQGIGLNAIKANIGVSRTGNEKFIVDPVYAENLKGQGDWEKEGGSGKGSG